MLSEETAPDTAEEPNPQEETKSVDETLGQAKEADATEEESAEEATEETTEEKQEEKEHEPPPESPRFKEVYGKMKRTEREAEKLKKEIETLKTQVKGVTDERTEEKQRERSAQIEGLWDDYSAAMAELDGAKAAKIQRQISELERKNAAPATAAPLKEDDIEKKIREREEESAVKGFKKRNSWFNKDSDDYNKRMRNYALAAEQELLESGFDGSYAELLQEVEKDIKETFKGKKASGLPNVAGVNPTKRITTSKVINLTDEQKEVAYGVYSGIPKAKAEEKYRAILKKQGGTR
jgi:hypothetical protein